MRSRPLLAELLARRELVGNLVARNLKQRYKGSALGFLWSLLHPLFLVLIYLAFIRLMRFPVRLPHLLVGVMAWQFLALCAGDAAGVILGHASLVKKTWFPRFILPLSAVLGNLVHFALSLLVLGVALPLLGAPPRAGWLLLPAVIALQFFFCLGLSLGLSALNVFFRDVEHLVPIGLMSWFFVTPVIYPPEQVLGNPSLPQWVAPVFFANPMAALLALYRHALLGEPLPPLALWPGFLVALAVFLAGALLFARLEPQFSDEL
ncbi:MAG TPA: ABC transporter permease [Candidatus Methanoperedens sp.]|nr:ABC transporter permease [Candidatus Methanoperedens sp.]